MAKKYVHCRQAGCGHRNDRTGGRRNCVACGHPLPKKPVRRHALVLSTITYSHWAAISQEIHGGDLDACGVCGRPPTFGRKHDRDHDHTTGLPRGLACGGDFGCNVMMPRKLTAPLARQLADSFAVAEQLGDVGDLARAVIGAMRPYLPRDLTAERAEQIACYLERANAYYLKGLDDAVA
jgi:hypothetical protein